MIVELLHWIKVLFFSFGHLSPANLLADLVILNTNHLKFEYKYSFDLCCRQKLLIKVRNIFVTKKRTKKTRRHQSKLGSLSLANTISLSVLDQKLCTWNGLLNGKKKKIKAFRIRARWCETTNGVKTIRRMKVIV